MTWVRIKVLEPGLFYPGMQIRTHHHIRTWAERFWDWLTGRVPTLTTVKAVNHALGVITIETGRETVTLEW